MRKQGVYLLLAHRPPVDWTVNATEIRIVNNVFVMRGSANRGRQKPLAKAESSSVDSCEVLGTLKVDSDLP